MASEDDDDTERLLEELGLLGRRLDRAHLARLYNRMGYLYRVLKRRGVPRRTLAYRAGVSRKAVDHLAGREPRQVGPPDNTKTRGAERCKRCGLGKDVVELDAEGLCVDCLYEGGWSEPE